MTDKDGFFIMKESKPDINLAIVLCAIAVSICIFFIEPMVDLLLKGVGL